MSAKILCFFLVFLVISYDIDAFTAGAGNIGIRGRKRGLVNKVGYITVTNPTICLKQKLITRFLLLLNYSFEI